MSDYELAVLDFKRRFVKGVLAKHKGNRSSTARELNMHRNTLSRLIEALRLRDDCLITRGNAEAYKNSDSYRAPATERRLM